jgi:hypothetical protein
MSKSFTAKAVCFAPGQALNVIEDKSLASRASHAASRGIVAEPMDAEQTPVGPGISRRAGRLVSLSQLERSSVAVMAL